jgi:hypothetical protein
VEDFFIMTTYQTLRERWQYHWDEAHKIEDSSKSPTLPKPEIHDCVDNKTYDSLMKPWADSWKFKTPEDEKKYNFHVSEAIAIYSRIISEFPDEEKAYQLDLGELARKRLDELKDEIISKGHAAERKRLLDEYRALSGE